MSATMERMTSSATQQVLHTTELLEEILLQLPLRKLLLAKSISKTFCATIEGSTRIQQVLFLRPIAGPGLVLCETAGEGDEWVTADTQTKVAPVLNPFLKLYTRYLERAAGISLSLRGSYLSCSVLRECMSGVEIHDAANTESCSHSMLLTQPLIQKLTIDEVLARHCGYGRGRSSASMRHAAKARSQESSVLRQQSGIAITDLFACNTGRNSFRKSYQVRGGEAWLVGKKAGGSWREINVNDVAGAEMWEMLSMGAGKRESLLIHHEGLARNKTIDCEYNRTTVSMDDLRRLQQRGASRRLMGSRSGYEGSSVSQDSPGEK